MLHFMSASLVNHFNKVIYGDWRLELTCLVNICLVFFCVCVFFHSALKSPDLAGNTHAAFLI